MLTERGSSGPVLGACNTIRKSFLCYVPIACVAVIVDVADAAAVAVDFAQFVGVATAEVDVDMDVDASDPASQRRQSLGQAAAGKMAS